MGADPARGRQPRPQQRHRPGRLHATRCALSVGVPGAAEAAPIHRRPGPRRLRRGARPTSTIPTDPAGRRYAGWPQYTGPDGPRPAELHGRRPRRPQLRHLRQPRRSGSGERGRQDRLRDGRHRLHQAAQRRLPERPAPSSTSPSRTCSTSTTWPRPATRSSPRPTSADASSPRASSSRSSSTAIRRTATASPTSTRRRRRPPAAPRATTASARSPGMRLISLDTRLRGRRAGTSADGNIDDPQFRWLEGELKQGDRGRRAGDPLQPSRDRQPDRRTFPTRRRRPAPSPTPRPRRQPGLRRRPPRLSTPIHLGDDMVALLHRYPHVIAWVAGHSHVNDVEPYPGAKGRGFWSVRVAAEADWPQQSRLLQLFDNRDGTLSLFSTIDRPRRRGGRPRARHRRRGLRRPPTSPRSAAPSPTTTPTGGAALRARPLRRGRRRRPQRRAADRRPAARLRARRTAPTRQGRATAASGLPGRHRRSLRNLVCRHRPGARP